MDLVQSELCNFDVICITESWLYGRTSDDDIKIENFKLFRRDRPGDHHGGICVYVRNNVFSKRRHNLELPTIECLWAEISIKVSKGAKIRNRYNQVPHLTQDTNGKVTYSQ